MKLFEIAQLNENVSWPWKDEYSDNNSLEREVAEWSWEEAKS